MCFNFYDRSAPPLCFCVGRLMRDDCKITTEQMCYALSDEICHITVSEIKTHTHRYKKHSEDFRVSNTSTYVRITARL